MAEQNGFTPIEARILTLLSDGKVHSRDEIHDCTYHAEFTTVYVHMHNLRKKLAPARTITHGTYLINGRQKRGYVLHVLPVESQPA